MDDYLEKALSAFNIKSASSRKLFIDKAVIKEYPINQPIFAEGKKSEFEYFLLKGVLHRYNVSEKGYAVTTGFYIAVTVITPHLARTSKDKSIFTLQALTDCLLAEIPAKEFDYLRRTNSEFHQFGQNIIEGELSRIFFSEMVNRSYSAKERLLNLRKVYPNIENLVPLNIIASYLGITSVSFSRLRAELTKR
jgi:CRP-like cAMP-binding protein